MAEYRNLKNAYRIKISRNRTQVVAYENLQIMTTSPMKENKPKKIKPTVPSDYADHNYYLRMKQRRESIKGLCYNNFELPNASMITLTFAESALELDVCHKQFKQFVQRLNSHYNNLRYVATFSRQSNGNWHYHMMCNFSKRIRNSDIQSIWGNGITHISKIEKKNEFTTAVNYLVSNMIEMKNDLKGRKAYLFSKNTEREIWIDSWKESDTEEFDEVFERVEASPRKILYETKKHLGIQGENVDEETGEIYNYMIPDRELNPLLESAGYENMDTVYTHLSSSARFPEKYSELNEATLKQKKFKRTISKNVADMGKIHG